MKQLLEYIIPNIVKHPEDVLVTEESVTDGTKLIIKVNPEDIGRVIGKSGKIIKAIRQITRVMAIKRGTKVHVDLLDEGDNNHQKPDSQIGDQTAAPPEETTPPEETVADAGNPIEETSDRPEDSDKAKEE